MILAGVGYVVVGLLTGGLGLRHDVVRSKGEGVSGDVVAWWIFAVPLWPVSLISIAIAWVWLWIVGAVGQGPYFKDKG